MTTSKKILWLNYGLTAILTFTTLICTFAQVECSNLVIVTGLAWGELAVHSAVYAKKASIENKIKISYSMIEKLADKYGIENVVSLFDTVTRD